MRMILGIAAAAALAGPAVALEQGCVGPTLPIGATPGLELGSSLSDVRARVPAEARCDDPQMEDGCEFTDRNGYTYTFTTPQQDGAGPPERWIYLKRTTRGLGARLPYGVLWSDSKATVERKLRAVSNYVSAKPSKVSTLACYSNRMADGYWATFAFDPNGRLSQVTLEGVYT